MSEHDVRLAGIPDRDVVLDALTLAFVGDPCMRYTLSTAHAFLAGFRAFATAMGGEALEQGSAWVAGEGAAAALWLPPGVSSNSEAMLAVIAPTLADEKWPVIGEVAETMRQYHPQAPHWYLAMVGVDPAHQGMGLGSAILKESLKRCDADGMMAYLESSNPKNIPLYERHGFEVIGVVQPGNFPPMYPMIRAAR